MGTVLINGRTAVHAGSKGELHTKDICYKTSQRIPITYHNVAKSEDADQCAHSVFINGHPICHKKSIFKKSTGDEAGDHKGKFSGTIKGKAEFITASPNVFAESMAAVRNHDYMVSNNRNTAPARLSQPNGPLPKPVQNLIQQAMNKPIGPNKIGLEVTALNPRMLYEQCLAEDKNEQLKAIAADDVKRDRSREVIIENLQSGKIKLSLQINDKQYGGYKIPLGETSSIPKDQAFKPEETLPNILIPLDLKRYTFPESTGSQTQPPEIESFLNDRLCQYHELNLRPGGWVYVFLNGHLWRECQVQSQGALRDANLREFKGEDYRPATGEIVRWLTVPYQIDHKIQTIEIAYSEIQWTWAYINALGGMAKDDPRLSQHPKPSHDLNRQLPQDVPKPDKTKRLQNITSLLGQWQGIKIDPNHANPNAPKPTNTDWFKLKRPDYIYTVYVYDPIGIARDMANDVATTVYDMIATKACARKNPDYLMAQIVQQLVTAEPKYKKYIDSKTVESVLRWQDYVKTLKHIDAATQALGDYLLADNYSSAKQGMSVATAMNDYWAQTGDPYLEGIELIGLLLANITLAAGSERYKKLFDDNHPLIQAPFHPNKAQIETLVKNNLTAAAQMIQYTAGATAINKTINRTVFNYSQALVLHFTQQKYTLKRTSTDLNSMLDQLDTPEETEPLSWPGEIYQEKVTITQVNAELWQTVKVGEESETYTTALGKSVNWLKAHEPMVRMGAIGFFTALEGINLAEAAYQLHKTHDNKLESATSLTKFIGAGLELFKEIKTQNIKSQNLSKEAENLALKNSIGGLAAATHGVSFVGNALAIVLDINQAIENYKRGDRSLGTISSINALGDITCTVSYAISGLTELQELGVAQWLTGLRMINRLIQFSKTEIAIDAIGLNCSRLTIFAWIGFSIVLIAQVLHYILSKTPLEKWLAHGPFGGDHSKRFLGPDQDGKAQWASWKNPANAQMDLFTLLYGFILEHQFIPDSPFAKHLIITIGCPLFIPGKSRLYFSLEGKNLADGIIQPIPITNSQQDIQCKKNEQGLTTITINYSNIKDQYVFKALLDLYGDGKIMIPAVFTEGVTHKVEPQQIDFHIPYSTPDERIALKEML